MPYLGVFGREFSKNIVIFEISTFELVKLQNFVKKKKCLNLGPKIPILSIFDQKCFIWVFLGKKFKKKLLSYLKSVPLSLSNCKIS